MTKKYIVFLLTLIVSYPFIMMPQEVQAYAATVQTYLFTHDGTADDVLSMASISYKSGNDDYYEPKPDPAVDPTTTTPTSTNSHRWCTIAACDKHPENCQHDTDKNRDDHALAIAHHDYKGSYDEADPIVRLNDFDHLFFELQGASPRVVSYSGNRLDSTPVIGYAGFTEMNPRTNGYGFLCFCNPLIETIDLTNTGYTVDYVMYAAGGPWQQEHNVSCIEDKCSWNITTANSSFYVARVELKPKAPTPQCNISVTPSSISNPGTGPSEETCLDWSSTNAVNAQYDATRKGASSPYDSFAASQLNLFNGLCNTTRRPGDTLSLTVKNSDGDATTCTTILNPPECSLQINGSSVVSIYLGQSATLSWSDVPAAAVSVRRTSTVDSTTIYPDIDIAGLSSIIIKPTKSTSYSLIDSGGNIVVNSTGIACPSPKVITNQTSTIHTNVVSPNR